MWCSLIGFMGAGKTTTARLLAEHAVIDVVDLDALVTEREGRSIPEIFAERGEAAFRDAEIDALRSLDPDRELVLACGGGVVERDDAVALLRDRGAVVWLDLPWERVRSRLAAGAPGERPLLEALDRDGLRELFIRRRPGYARAAHVRLRADQGDPELIARRVMAARLRHARSRRGPAA